MQPQMVTVQKDETMSNLHEQTLEAQAPMVRIASAHAREA